MVFVSIAQLLDADRLALELVAGGDGLDRRITVPRIQKPGLALTGFTTHVHPHRLQVLGLTEIDFLAHLPPEERVGGLEALFAASPAAMVVTRGLEIPPDAVRMSDEREVPLMRTPLMSSHFIAAVTKFLEEQMSPRASLHGVLIDVLGVGILLLGKSGIGKSEAALDLVLRGHRLVADDMVEIQLRPPNNVYGAGATIIKHHMEIRGLGIINIKDLFGISAVRDAKKVELVAELVEWDRNEEYDRIGVEDLYHEILGVDVAMIRIPIRPGRNITSIIEVAARNQLLKYQGKHSAREFQDRLNRAIADARPGVPIIDDVE